MRDTALEKLAAHSRTQREAEVELARLREAAELAAAARAEESAAAARALDQSQEKLALKTRELKVLIGKAALFERGEITKMATSS